MRGTGVELVHIPLAHVHHNYSYSPSVRPLNCLPLRWPIQQGTARREVFAAELLTGTTVKTEAIVQHSVSWPLRRWRKESGSIAYVSQATARLPQDLWKGKEDNKFLKYVIGSRVGRESSSDTLHGNESREGNTGGAVVAL